MKTILIALMLISCGTEAPDKETPPLEITETEPEDQKQPEPITQQSSESSPEEETIIPDPAPEQLPDGVYLDESTGLIWKKAEEGTFTFLNNTICDDLDFGGFTDWRLPSVPEVEEFRANAFLDDPTVIDIPVPDSDFYSIWTGTEDELDADRQMYIKFQQGAAGVSLNKTSSMRIRCIRDQ